MTNLSLKTPETATEVASGCRFGLRRWGEQQSRLGLSRLANARDQLHDFIAVLSNLLTLPL